VELVAVVIGAEDDRLAVRRPGDLTYRVLGEEGQLVRVAPGGGLPPEVELAADVGRVGDLGAVRREGQCRLVAPDSGELLKGVAAGCSTLIAHVMSSQSSG